MTDTNPPAQDTAQQPASRPVGWILAGGVALFAAGLIGNPWFEQQIRSALPASLQSAHPVDSTPAQIAPLTARLATLETRVSALEETPSLQPLAPVSAPSSLTPPTQLLPPADAPSQQIQQQMNGLDFRLTALQQTAAGAAAQAQGVQANLAALETRVAGLQGAMIADATTLRTQMQRTLQLTLLASAQRQIDAGRPLEKTFPALVQAFGITQPALMALKAVENGGPTLADLRARFIALQPQLNTAAQQAASPTAPSFWEKMKAQVTTLVQIQRSNAPIPAAATPTLRTARALAQVQDGRIAEAITTLTQSPPGIRNAATTWLIEAKTYVAARTALETLEAVALQDPAPTTPPAP